MVIKELLEYGTLSLANIINTDSLSESRNILSFLLNKSPLELSINGESKVDEIVVSKFKEILNRRVNGEPLQYILNSAYFYGYEFYVDERCLIPRFDTEILVNEVIKLGEKIDKAKILEIGAGSGAISSTVAMELKNSEVIAVDISEDALEVCRINKNNYNIPNITFIKSNLFENVLGKYDVIFSNPPYIKSADMLGLQKEVRMEPTLALDGGLDGLDFYRDIIEKVKFYLSDGGYVLFEIGFDQGEDVKNLLLDRGFNKIEIMKDLQGYDRIVKAKMED